MIVEQIRIIDRTLEDLRDVLDDHQAALEKHREEREEFQKEQWRQRKRAVTISHMSEDLEAGQRKLALYESERAEVAQSVHEILAALKGLRAALTE